MKFQIAYIYDKQRRFAIKKWAQDQDRHLGCKLYWQVWCQNTPGLWTVEQRVENHLCSIISILSLFNCSWLCHPCFCIRNTRLSSMNDFRKFKNVARFVVSCHQRNCDVRVIGYNFRNRMNVKDKENGTKHWHFCLILYSFSFAAFMNWSVQFYEPLYQSDCVFQFFLSLFTLI